jgi:hypothetical protein
MSATDLNSLAIILIGSAFVVHCLWHLWDRR